MTETQQAVEEIKKSNAAFKDEVITKTLAENEKLVKELDETKKKTQEALDQVAVLGGTVKDQVELIKGLNAKASQHIVTHEDIFKMKLERNLKQMVRDNAAKFLDFEKTGKFEEIKFKASAESTGSLTGTGSPYPTYLPWQPGMEPIGQYRFRSLVGTTPSDFDTVYFPRANTPVGAGSFSRQTTEGNAKDQVDRGWTMITVNLTAFAGYLIASRQSLRNIPFMQAWLPTSLNEQLLDQEDADFANTLVAGATGSTTGVTVGTTVNIEAITILIKNLLKKKYYANAVALDPDVWQKILVTKAVTSGQYSLPNVVVVDAAGTVRILGKPIYPVNWLTGSRCLVGDFTKATICESEGLTFRQSDSHASTFIANQVTFLLERVQQLAIYRPDAFVTCLLTAST